MSVVTFKEIKPILASAIKINSDLETILIDATEILIYKPLKKSAKNTTPVRKNDIR